MAPVFSPAPERGGTSQATQRSDAATTIELPAPLLEDVEQRLEYTDFDDASEYVTFVLEEVLSAVDDGASANYDAVDRDEVESRLESLGYLNE